MKFNTNNFENDNESTILLLETNRTKIIKRWDFFNVKDKINNTFYLSIMYCAQF